MLYKTLTLVVCLGLPSLSYADAWSILGPRPLGMGGAFVGMAEGSLAQHWNPAGLAEELDNVKWEIAIPVGAKADFTGGVLKDANTLMDLSSQFKAIQTSQGSGAAGAMNVTQIGAFYKGLAAIADLNNPGKGALADVNGGANFKIGKFAFSVNNFTQVGAAPYVDLQNIGLGSGSGLSGVTFTNASTTLCGGSSCTGAATSANTVAATTIQTALGSQYASLDALTGGALSAGGITSGNIGDALVNIAAYNGMTTAQILDAATTISQNAAAVAPIIQGKTATNVYKDNTSNLTLKGGSFTDIAMSYGHSFFLPGLYVGGNLKAIVGTVSYVRYDILNNNNSTLSHFRDNIATSLQPGIDLGALWQADKLFTSLPCRPRIGVVGRNLNDPKFDQPAIAITNGESAHYSENGQVRMGVALTPLHFWNIAADIDLTNNLTPLPGYHSRMFGVGTEVNVFNRSWINIPLRAGIMQNIANASSKLAYTAGFGVNLAHLRVDVGGAISSEQTQVNSGNSGSKSQKVPSSAAVALQLALAF